ncbi:hypothetical protein SDJN03_07331, partial [Cucurbita argyrosperma subsp. sororia]
MAKGCFQRGYCNFTDPDFQYASFWVHFHLLPLACFSRKIATAFGKEELQYGDWLRGMRREMGLERERTENLRGKRSGRKRTPKAVMTRTADISDGASMQPVIFQLPAFSVSLPAISILLCEYPPNFPWPKIIAILVVCSIKIFSDSAIFENTVDDLKRFHQSS